MQNDIIPLENPITGSWFKTEYKPEYCEMLCDYAYNNFDIEGFYGEYNISSTASRVWEDQYPEWKDAVVMASYKVKAGLNNYFSKLLQYSSGVAELDKDGNIKSWKRAPNFDLMQKILFKMSDNNLKIEKDTGALKRKGLEEARKDKETSPRNQDVFDLASKIAEALTGKE